MLFPLLFLVAVGSDNFMKTFQWDEFYVLISRLNARTRIPIEFSNIRCNYFDVKRFFRTSISFIQTILCKMAVELMTCLCNTIQVLCDAC